MYCNEFNKRNSIGYIFAVLVFEICFVFVSVLLVLISRKLIGDEAVFNSSNSFLQKPSPKTFTVVIDAGHGGEDGGAVSDAGVAEKDLNLDIAKKLADFLSLSDVNIVMIRNDDRLMYNTGQENHKKYYDITNRVKIVSEYDGALLVSIHQNKFPIKKYSGFQVYYSKNNPESAIVADYIQSNIKMLLQPDNNRRAKMADENIRLLDSVTNAAVIAECGFLSNVQEAELLSTSQYRNKIAYILYLSVIQYLSET